MLGTSGSRIFLASLVCAAVAAAEVPTRDQVAEVLAKAEAYILGQQQDDGGFTEGARYPLGITQLALIGFSMPPALAKDDPRLAKALAFMNAFSQPDGGLYPPEEGLGTYHTSLALLTWKATGTGDPALIAKARNYLFGVQETAEGVKKGGFGYGNRKGSEDLANSSFAIQALRAAEVPPSDPHLKAALSFLEKCQDLSAVNALPWVQNSGGGVYNPDPKRAAGSWVPATGEQPKITAYGTMTYALIQSYMALDLTAEDPRLKAALAWATGNYRFDVNPGITRNKGREGLFYYYASVAKTFAGRGVTTVAANGKDNDWRADLFAAITERAQFTKTRAGAEALFWINDADRWGEGVPALATCYVIHALKHLHKTLP